MVCVFAACAPSSTQTNTPETIAKPNVFAPKISETPTLSIGRFSATLNNQPVELISSDAIPTLITNDFTISVLLSPNSFKSIDNAALETYGDRYLYSAAQFLLDLLYSQPTGFVFLLFNNSDEPIRVVWDDSVIILPDGKTSRIIRSPVNYLEMNNPQPPAIVPPSTRIDEYAGPISKVEPINSEWITYPLFGEIKPGMTTTLYLALDVKGTRQNIAFTFEATAEQQMLR